MDLRPGKGVHLVMNENILAFIAGCLESIGELYSDDTHDNSPLQVLEGLLANNERPNDPEAWTEVKDDFGHKVFRTIGYKKGELRFTVILTKQNELRFDLREWFDPAAA